MKKYTYKLTEEIARWAFEVKCRQSADWYIAFTNPTAGPWKVIKCTDREGKLGEVYRFDLEETRPDIIIVNDKLEIVIIIEAKDSLNKLLAGDQAEKSVMVVANLFKTLSGLYKSPFWGHRTKYAIVTGLLWGAKKNSTLSDRNILFDKYHTEIVKYPQLDSRIIIGIESLKNPKSEEICCVMYYKSYEKNGLETISPAAIAHTLNLDLKE